MNKPVAITERAQKRAPSREKKQRLDVLLLERELVESRRRGQALIMAGRVQVNGQVALKAGMPVPVDAVIQVKEPVKYVSRGGQKLEGALAHFKIDPVAMVCADIGASNGGFTDCLLQHGASRVIAIDVGYGQLAWKLHADPRVIVMDRVNIRQLQALEELVDLAVIDVSFISLTLVLPVAQKFLQPWGEVIALIKPQFEAGREQVGKGGIIRDPRVHAQTIQKIAEHALQRDWRVLGLCRSPITGADGNQEFFIHLAIDPLRANLDVANELATLIKIE
ncbi:MAG: TlyA family RNA methyltransferase [Chloroflexi bacterium]|nr:TlyA family RNA methyltransferase [Chloroflexota bacterium]